MQNIGIDVGRHETKAVTKDRQIKFKSTIGEWRERNLINDDQYEVWIDGKPYFVHDLAEESFFKRENLSESKLHNETFVLFMTAVGLLAEPGEPLSITTGVPINQHNPQTKLALTELLTGTHTIRIGNGYTREYHISDLSIVPESTAAYWDLILEKNGYPKMQSVFLGKKMRGIDMGNRTVNAYTISSRKFLDRESTTLNYGIGELLNASQNPSQEQMEGYVRRIVSDLSRKWLSYNPKEDVIHLIGGGAVLLGNYFKQHYPLIHVADDPVFANANGFYKMNLAKYNRQQQTAK